MDFTRSEEQRATRELARARLGRARSGADRPISPGGAEGRGSWVAGHVMFPQGLRGISGERRRVRNVASGTQPPGGPPRTIERVIVGDPWYYLWGFPPPPLLAFEARYTARRNRFMLPKG